MGLFDRSALPDHIDDQHEIDGAFPDDAEYGSVIKWLKKQTKHWEAFSNRSPRGIALMLLLPAALLAILLIPVVALAVLNIWFDTWRWWMLIPFVPIPVLRKWREKPFVIAGICGAGSWRLEKMSGGHASAPRRFLFWTDLEGEYYLSRIQPWAKWHFILFWPLGVQWMLIPKKEHVQPTGIYNDMDGKVWFFYFPYHFDGDHVHWWPSGYGGRNPK